MDTTAAKLLLFIVPALIFSHQLDKLAYHNSWLVLFLVYESNESRKFTQVVKYFCIVRVFYLLSSTDDNAN
jgi:hypothetical protein